MLQPEFEPVFQQLRKILAAYEDQLVKVEDQAAIYYLDAAHIQKNKKPLFFGSVRIGKRYVSYHLMPIYLWPDLMATASDTLKSRLKGKSCFNFTSSDHRLFGEVAELTQQGFERYRAAGYLD